MNIILFSKLYAVALTTSLAIDLTWLTSIAKKFYLKHLGYIFTDKPSLLIGLLFYLLFSAGLIIFVVFPALEKKSIFKALSLGFLFGLIVYSAYDLTNHATIKNWPPIVTIVDMLWGATLSCIVSGITFYVGRWLLQ